jgi:cold shock CspA family protein
MLSSLLRAPRALRLPAIYGARSLSTVTGTALRWNQGRGFGFIEPDDGGDHVFVHSSAITDGDILKQGAAVSYTLGADDRSGRDCAKYVTGGSSSGEPRGGVAGAPPEGMLQGTVKLWTSKGFGFIAPDDGGDDVFCHFSVIEDGNALSQGATVHFTRELDEVKGKERAGEVIGGFAQEYDGGGGRESHDVYGGGRGRGRAAD